MRFLARFCQANWDRRCAVAIYQLNRIAVFRRTTELTPVPAKKSHRFPRGFTGRQKMSSYKNRPRDFAYLAWINSQQCIVCESQFKLQPSRSYAHHAGQRGLGRRADDATAIPLCWRHHDRASPIRIHALGKRFWVVYKLELNVVIAELQERYRRHNPGWRNRRPSESDLSAARHAAPTWKKLGS